MGKAEVGTKRGQALIGDCQSLCCHILSEESENSKVTHGLSERCEGTFVKVGG